VIPLPPTWRWCWVCPACRVFFLIRAPGDGAGIEQCGTCGRAYHRDRGVLVLEHFPGADA
jgi:hypothetical protein